MLIMCVTCERWSHALCYKIMDSDTVPETHVCVTCPGRCTDPTLSKLDKITAQATALWRRTLFTLTEVKRVKEPELAQRLDIDVEVAKRLINRLLSERFIKSPAKSTSKFGYIVNKSEITARGFKQYFGSPGNNSQSLPEKSQSLPENSQSLPENSHSLPGVHSQSLPFSQSLPAAYSSQDMVQETASLNIAREKRKRVADDNGESFELSDSQSWTRSGKKLRSSVLRTPVKL